MTLSSTRKTVFICNMVIAVLCLFSIVAYFIFPFWKVTVNYNLSAETLESTLPESGSDDSEANAIYKNLNLSEMFGDEGIQLSLSLSLKTTDIFRSISADPATLVADILADNVHNLISQLDEPFGKIVKKSMENTVRSTFEDELKKRIKESLGEDTTDEEAKEELDDIGLDDQYINQKTNLLIDHIYSNTATAYSAADQTIAIIEDSIETMRENGHKTSLSDEERDDLRNNLIEKFKKIENADGKLNPEEFSSEFLMDMLNSSSSSSDDLDKMDTINAGSVSIVQTASKKAEAAKEDVRQALADKLADSLGAAATPIALVLKSMSYTLIFTFFTWLSVILKILLRMNKTNNAVKMKLPIWFGSLPFVSMCLTPTILLKVLSSRVSALSALSIKFFSAGIVSFIIGILLAVFSVAYYGKLRRILKRAAKLGYTDGGSDDDSSDDSESSSEE